MKLKHLVVFLIFNSATGQLIAIGAKDAMPKLPVSMVAFKISDDATPSPDVLRQLADNWATVQIDTATFSVVTMTQQIPTVQTQTTQPAILQPQTQ